jgi:acetylornithine deacetylase
MPLLHDLVAIDSVNPSLVPGGAGEAAVVDCLEAFFRAAGVDTVRQHVAEGRPNLVAVIEGRRSGPGLALCGHTDTVGVEGMTDPFTPVERNGRLHGRGAGDMKAGLAAACRAAVRVAERGVAAGRLLVAAVVDEEFASLGAEAFVRDWEAEAAVVVEPTDLRVGIAHKGFLLAEVATTGVAAHGSRPAEGRDAIFRMGRVLAALEQHGRTLEARASHPALGTPSIHASTIRGGREWSTYPDHCLLQLERRTLPGELTDAVMADIERLLDVLRADDGEFQAHARLVLSRPGYAIDSRAEIAQALLAVLTPASGGLAGSVPEPVGLSFWTDAAIFAGAGIPSVVFGPTGGGYHALDEWVDLASVETTETALVALAERFLQ